MPWDKAGARRHNKRANTPEKQARWSGIANAVLKQSGDEGKAIRIANSKMTSGGYLKQKVGNRDTKHGRLDLPVAIGGAMKKPKMRFFIGGLLDKRRKIAAGEAEAKAMSARPAEHPTDKKIREAEEAATVKKAKGGVIRCGDGCAVRGKTKGVMR